MACQPWNPVTYASCAAGLAGKAVSGAFADIARSFGQLAAHTTSWLWTQIGTAAAVHLGGPGFGQVSVIMAAITAVVAVALLVIQVVTAALRRDSGALLRAVKGLFVAFVAGGAAIAVVNELLAATDALAAGVVKTVLGTSLAGLGRMVLGTSAFTLSVFGAAGLLVVSLSVLAATFLVYAALVVRKVLLVVTAVFAPVAFAGSLADITVSWTRKWIEFTLALVFSKLVLVLIFITGYEVLIRGAGQAGGGVTQEITQTIAGLLIVAVAGFAPWMAVKLVHFAGDHAERLHGMGVSITSGATTAAGVGRLAAKATPVATALSGGGLGAAGAGGTAGKLAAGGIYAMAARPRPAPATTGAPTGTGPGASGDHGTGARPDGPPVMPAPGRRPPAAGTPASGNPGDGLPPGAAPSGTGWPR